MQRTLFQCNIQTICKKHWEPKLDLLGHQVNTLFCLIAANRNSRQKQGGRSREQKTTDFGELWLQAFVSNLKTKSSGNIKTSLKITLTYYVGSIWHSITLDMYTIPKLFSHTPTSTASQQSHEIYLHIIIKCSFALQISYAITRHHRQLKSGRSTSYYSYLNIKAEAHSFQLKHTVNSFIWPPDFNPVTTIYRFACFWSVW